MRTLAPAILLIAACGPTADLDLELAQSEVIPTVFTATLSGEASGLDAAWIEYGQDGAFDHQAPMDVEADLPWNATLLGMKPGAEYSVRTAVEIDGEVYSGREHLASTGLVPSEFPDLGLERGDGESFGGFLFTSVLADSASVVLDEDGAYVWWYQPDGFISGGRTAMSRDGEAVLTMDLNSHGNEENTLVRVSLDGSQVENTSIPQAHHDLYEHEDGRIAYLAHDPLEIDGSEVTGDSIVELLPDGTTQMIWSCWDTEDKLPYNNMMIGPGGEWPHANALDYLPDEDAYLVSFLYLNAIARIDRTTGAMDWVMGGSHSDFTLPDGGTDLFERTHQMHWLDDSVLVFVNGAQSGGVSYAIEYAVDEAALEVESIWEYWSDPSLTCVTLGDVHRFDGGNTLITYSYSGQMQEVTPEGEPVWVLSASMGGVFGYTTPVESLYVE